MTGRARANGEGSIFPYRNGYAAYAWVNTPEGRRKKKWVYGTTREVVHDKWLKLQQEASRGPVATRTPTVGEYLDYWLREIVTPTSLPRRSTITIDSSGSTSGQRWEPRIWRACPVAMSRSG